MKVMILAGGTGTGLWPVSRIYNPKQFVKLKKQKSIFQNTIEGCLKVIKPEDVTIVTNREYKYFVLDQLQEISVTLPEENIILEPAFKNTLHAVSVGVFRIKKIHGEDSDIIVIPLNSLVNDYSRIFNNKEYFHIEDKRDNIIIFGMDATGAYTGYGCIKIGTQKGVGYSVEEFIDNQLQVDDNILSSNKYLYNSGVLLFNSVVFLDELKTYHKDLYDYLERDIIDEAYNLDIKLTVEKGILEKSKKISVIHLEDIIEKDNIYSDFYKQYENIQDENGNITYNDNVFLEAKNNLVYAENEKVVSIVGCSDLVVIDQPDALLVCNKNQTEKVRDVALILKDKGDNRVDYHTTCYRPWGSYTVLEEGAGYKVKRITVLSGKKLSYQMHHHRSEHWVVVNGTATVTKEGVEYTVKQGESIFIRAEEKHRLENKEKNNLEVIEAQIGHYLEEDDIVRFEDDFGRGKH